MVPHLKTIRRSTLNLLKKFHEQGGLVVFAGDPPDFTDAVISEKP